MTHWNIGSWLQVLFFPCWRGFHVVRWTGAISAILSVSVVVGWVELRFWRRPHLDMTVKYPASVNAVATPTETGKADPSRKKERAL